MRKITGLLVALIVGGTVGLAVTSVYKPSIRHLLLSKTPTPVQEETKGDDLKKAQSLILLSKPNDALKIISKHQDDIENHSEDGPQWLALLVQASADAHDPQQLLHVYSFDPSALSKNENAALIVADQFIVSGNIKDYETLRNMWKTQATQADRWFVLDADALILEKKTPQAIEFLQSRTFEGPKDTGRLVRLALLHMNDQPKIAWNYLVEAQKKNPNSTDIRSYRAHFLESIGKPQLALVEYLAAASEDPSNPVLKDQVADFTSEQKNTIRLYNYGQKRLIHPLWTAFG